MNQLKPPSLTLKPEELDLIKCPNCGGEEFHRFITLRKVKALEFPDLCPGGVDGVLEMGKLRCLSCDQNFEFNANAAKPELLS